MSIRRAEAHHPQRAQTDGEQSISSRLAPVRIRPRHNSFQFHPRTLSSHVHVLTVRMLDAAYAAVGHQHKEHPHRPLQCAARVGDGSV